MADRTMKKGDTWPPLRGKAEDEDGLVDLTEADDLTVILKHTGAGPTLTGTPVPIDPPDDDGFNWRYLFQAGDTDELGAYEVELEVVWDAAATPPSVQTFPTTGFNSLEITDDLGGTA